MEVVGYLVVVVGICAFFKLGVLEEHEWMFEGRGKDESMFVPPACAH